MEDDRSEKLLTLEVERSSDAEDDRASRDGHDAARAAYSFKDTPFSSESVPAKAYYYRLKQVDRDGAIEYSAIRNARSFPSMKKIKIYKPDGKRIYHLSPLTV